MQSCDYFPVPGEAVESGNLYAPMARELADFSRAELIPFVRLVGCYRTEELEIVVIEVEPEIPQQPVHDIRSPERIAISVDLADSKPPEALALRKDFPLVPHTNLKPEGDPRSLCLFEEPHHTVKLRWSASSFVRQIHRWLTLSARGELHEADQRLEPLLIGSAWRVIVPNEFFSPDYEWDDEPMYLYITSEVERRLTLALTPQRYTSDKDPKFIGLMLNCETQTHGIIRAAPANLADLDRALSTAGTSLFDTLGKKLREWSQNKIVLVSNLLIFVRFPKRRYQDGPVEETEVWAFATSKNIRTIGIELGLWMDHDGALGTLIGPYSREGSEAIPIQILNPIPTLSRDTASQLNSSKVVDGSYVGIGAGALGSQVIMNLVRSGFGRWILVDDDQLLPHNLARHHLDGSWVGIDKATALAHSANTLFGETQSVTQGLVANVMTSTENAEVLEALNSADAILDFSASVTLARHLAMDVAANSRRVSVFMNPAGTDLVILAEDANRRIRLDQLEMQYYRSLIETSDLGTHLLVEGQRLRYSMACRESSSTIPQDLVAVHSGIGAFGVRLALQRDEASIIIWQAADDMSVSRIDIDTDEMECIDVGGWAVCVDRSLLRSLIELRAARLPNETGGVLVGSYDMQRSILFVVGMIPSPPDSVEWPTLYVRGYSGLSPRLQEIDRRTAGWLQYVGEWHTHPCGSSCSPSYDDRTVFSWLATHVAGDGIPPLMAIIGDGGLSRWMLCSPDEWKEVSYDPASSG